MVDRGGNRNPGFAQGSSKNFRLTQPDALMSAGEKPENRAKAVLCIASNARDAVDCYRLLDMLGLTAEERDPEWTNSQKHEARPTSSLTNLQQ